MALCTLAEAKLQLGKTGTADDVELQTYIDAVTPPVEDYCGAILAATVSLERHDVYGSTLVLRSERIVSVTTLTQYQGTTANTFTEVATPALAGPYTFTREGIILRRLGSSGYEQSFDGTVYVTYVAGFAAVPADVNLAARMIVQEWWKTQRGSIPLPLQGGQDEMQQFQAFSMRRVQELLGHRRRAPGIA